MMSLVYKGAQWRHCAEAVSLVVSRNRPAVFPIVYPLGKNSETKWKAINMVKALSSLKGAQPEVRVCYSKQIYSLYSIISFRYFPPLFGGGAYCRSLPRHPATFCTQIQSISISSSAIFVAVGNEFIVYEFWHNQTEIYQTVKRRSPTYVEVPTIEWKVAWICYKTFVKS